MNAEEIIKALRDIDKPPISYSYQGYYKWHTEDIGRDAADLIESLQVKAELLRIAYTTSTNDLQAQLAASQRRERAAAELIPHICETCRFTAEQYVSVDEYGGFFMEDCTTSGELEDDENGVCQNWEWRGPEEGIKD